MRSKLSPLFGWFDARSSYREPVEPILALPSPEEAEEARASEIRVRESRYYDDPPARSATLSVPLNFNAAAREMSPRQLAAWAHEMYLAGKLSWEEYRMAGFPSELHPDYNRTVGALTGRLASPDRPRDMVREWEEKLAFARRHNEPLDMHIRRTEKILKLLRRQEAQAANDL